MLRKTFSHTPDEAMSDGLAKACDLRENLFCWSENQLFHWKSNRMRNLHAYTYIAVFSRFAFWPTVGWTHSLESFRPSFPNNLLFPPNFVSNLIPFPIFLLFQKVSELMIRCFNLSCITCSQVGGFCARTTSSVDLVKLPALPSKSKDSYMILNCLLSSSDKVSSHLNILTLLVMGTIGSSSSPLLFCSLLFF